MVDTLWRLGNGNGVSLPEYDGSTALLQKSGKFR